MVDREEVLKGLEHHRHLEASRNELSHDECFDCPYRPDGEDTCASLDRMIDDALELLKEQLEQKFFVDFDGKIKPLPIQKHGNWIPIKSPTGVKYGGFEEYTVREVMCSECGFTDDVSASIYTYCPECGAKMGGKVKQDGEA